ncbi:MAG: hypothetical protein AB1540_05400 [Bdellovibrionota bacterium]
MAMPIHAAHAQEQGPTNLDVSDERLIQLLAEKKDTIDSLLAIQADRTQRIETRIQATQELGKICSVKKDDPAAIIDVQACIYQILPATTKFIKSTDFSKLTQKAPEATLPLKLRLGLWDLEVDAKVQFILDGPVSEEERANFLAALNKTIASDTLAAAEFLEAAARNHAGNGEQDLAHHAAKIKMDLNDRKLAAQGAYGEAVLHTMQTQAATAKALSESKK